MAIAGAGSIAVVHALAAGPAGIDISAVASRGGKSARHLAGQLDADRVSVDRLPAGADLMVVATPPGTHQMLFEQGLSAGSAVLVEKPLTTTLASADEMVAVAERPGSPASMVAENLLSSPYWQAALRHRGQTGTLTHLSARVVQSPPNWGHFLEPLDAGGVLFDLGPHPISLVLGLAGEDVVGVAAELSSTREDGADDDATVRIRFASGLRADIELSWTSPESHWAIQAASPDTVVRLEFVPEARIEVNGDPVDVPRSHDVVDPRLETMGYVDQLRTLASLIRPDDTGSGSTHSDDGPDSATGPVGTIGQSVRAARDVLEIIVAAYSSAGRGGDEISIPFTGDRDLTPMQLWRGDPDTSPAA